MAPQWTPPPNWPAPPAPGWAPPAGWQPDPAWGPPPPGWNFYPAGGGWAGRHKALVIVLAVVVVAGIVGGVVAATSGGHSKASTGASSNPSATSSRPSSPTSSAPSTGTSAPPPELIAVPGYTYTALPSQLAPILTSIKSTALVTSVVGHGVRKGSSQQVNIAIVVLQYKPQISDNLDLMPISKVLANATKGAEAFVGGVGRQHTYTMSGTQVRTLSKAPLSMAIAYQRGGHLIEIFGPYGSKAVLDFTSAYLSANS